MTSHVLRLWQAVFEKSPESAQATPELMKANLFSNKPYAHCLVAELNDPEKTIIGISLCESESARTVTSDLYTR